MKAIRYENTRSTSRPSQRNYQRYFWSTQSQNGLFKMPLLDQVGCGLKITCFTPIPVVLYKYVNERS